MRRGVAWQPLMGQIAGWSGVMLGAWLLSLLLMQALFGRALNRLQILQLGRELALIVRLTELTLERYPPALIRELTGLDLTVALKPGGTDTIGSRENQRRQDLQRELCARLSHCPILLPATAPDSDDVNAVTSQHIWIELISPLEPVWLRTELPVTRLWPPEPMLLLVALVGAVIITGVLYLLTEVERPLRGLERALSSVGDGNDPQALPAHGAPEVRRITHRFNAMVQRLAANRQERATMLAGIAHDLRAPITRLQFRLSLPSLNSTERARCNTDLEALERITGQFLLYAGGGEQEEPVHCPLDQWLSEVVAGHPQEQLILDLNPIEAWVRPVALGRAVSNLIDNALTYGQSPIVVRLLDTVGGIAIEVWDQGTGMPEQQWQRALQPFQRLDEARGEQGHCGLGLAIVSHVMQRHSGAVAFRSGEGTPGRFAVILTLTRDGALETSNMQKS